MTLKPLCFASKGGTIGLRGSKDPLFAQVKALLDERTKDAKKQPAPERVPADVCLADLDEECLRILASERRAVRTRKGACVTCYRFEPLPAVLEKASDDKKRFPIMHFLTNDREDGSLRIIDLITA